MDHAPPELSADLLAAVDSMQAFPMCVQSILQLTREASCAPKDLVEVINKDPVMTVKVLRVVNSVYYSLPRKIASIDQAVVFLGFNPIKNLALGIAAVGMLPGHTVAGFDAHRYLMHSLMTAGIARQLASRLADTDPHDLFIAGLLHDFGKVVVAQVMPAEYSRAAEFAAWHELSLHDALHQIAGIDQVSLGAALLEHWRFPQVLVDALRQQHQPTPESSSLCLGIFSANYISEHLGIGFGGTPRKVQFSPLAASRLGGTLQDVLDGMGDLEPLRQEARRFSRT